MRCNRHKTNIMHVGKKMEKKTFSHRLIYIEIRSHRILETQSCIKAKWTRNAKIIGFTTWLSYILNRLGAPLGNWSHLKPTLEPYPSLDKIWISRFFVSLLVRHLLRKVSFFIFIRKKSFAQFSVVIISQKMCAHLCCDLQGIIVQKI